MRLPIKNIAPLVPHSGDMVLIDEILSYDDEGLVAIARLTQDHVFAENGSVPNYIAIEIMAQAVAAWSGCHCVDRGKPITLGFLLGSRQYELFCDVLPINSVLKITIKSSLQDSSGFGVFQAEMHWLSGEKPLLYPANGLLAKAGLSVFSPKDENYVHKL
ncbi:dehydratase [Pasteurellaceae bacterium LIM206]|nr:dehydratase [Pasteurellaceae bacterium LIM206]